MHELKVVQRIGVFDKEGNLVVIFNISAVKIFLDLLEFRGREDRRFRRIFVLDAEPGRDILNRLLEINAVRAYRTLYGIEYVLR